MEPQNGSLAQRFIYDTNAEHVERHRYKVKVAPRTQKLPDAVLKGDIPLFYHPINPHVPELTMCTIRGLIDLTGLKEHWEIIFDADVLNIIRFLNAYIVELRDLIDVGAIDKTVENKVFIINMIEFHKQITTIGLRLLNRRPDLLEYYNGADSPLLTGLRAFGTNFNQINNPFDSGNQIKNMLSYIAEFTKDQKDTDKPRNINDPSQFLTFTTPF